MARLDRRIRRKELQRVIRNVERRGLSPVPEPVEMAALVALVDRRLAAGADTGRSSRVMALLATLQDKSNAHAPGMDRVACRKGCHYCCDIYVSAQAPRLFAMADWLRRNSDDLQAEIARLEVASISIRGKDADARATAVLACPFLRGGDCGVYPVRPAACRGYFSLSVEACSAGAQGRTETIPTPSHIQRLRGGYELALSAVLDQWRLPTAHYELPHGVLVALRETDAEARWFNGEDVFGEVAADLADDAMEPGMNRLEAEFREILWLVAHGDPATGPFAARFPDWCRGSVEPEA